MFCDTFEVDGEGGTATLTGHESTPVETTHIKASLNGMDPVIDLIEITDGEIISASRADDVAEQDLDGDAGPRLETRFFANPAHDFARVIISSMLRQLNAKRKDDQNALPITLNGKWVPMISA
jgi:hypothetical protein